MCQYDARCKVGTHRPGTVCPYAGVRGSYGWGVSPPIQQAPTGSVRSGRPTAGTAGGLGPAPQMGAIGSGIDLLAWLLALKWWDGTLTVGVILAGVVLVAVPFLIGGELLSKCRAWINDGSRRCEQPRHGFLRRCADHRSQALTLYDVAGGLSILLGVLNVLVLMNVVLGGAP